MAIESLCSRSLRTLVGCAAAIPLLVLVSVSPPEKADYILLNGTIYPRPIMETLGHSQISLLNTY